MVSKTNAISDTAECGIFLRSDIKYIFKYIFITYDNGYEGSFGKTVTGGLNLDWRVKEVLLNDI